MYELSRYVSYLEKNSVYSVYCNFNLYFFKGITYTWFKRIINNEDIQNIDKEFIDFLLKKEIIVKVGEEYV